MKRLSVFLLILFSSTILLLAQKSKVIGTFQLIENEKYDEAKRIIEDATKKKSTRNWPRTWYARGLLCLDAYEKGAKKNDEKLTGLYPDQLYVAYSSFEKSRAYDKRGRFDKLLAPKYVLLANDLISLGEKHYEKEEYDEAYRAYKYALKINKINYLDIKTDTNLLYNTALSAYKSKNWDEAIDYLSDLNEMNYSSNVPHLMFAIYIMKSDTVSAHKALMEGIKDYEDKEDLLLLLVDLLFKKNDTEEAVKVLDDAFEKDSSNYIYPYTKGLLYQKMEKYKDAIDAYKVALTIPSDSAKVYSGLGTCYYNIGAEMEEKARTLSNNYEYRKVKKRSASAFDKALKWFEEAYALDQDNEEIISKLNLLYVALNRREKIIHK